MATWSELEKSVRQKLPYSAEAAWIVEEISGIPFASAGSKVVDETDKKRFFEMVQSRLEGEPLQYIFGHWPFRELDLLINRSVLIPRPETEHLVDIALVELSGIDEPNVVDLGTGTGAIGLSIASEVPNAKVWLTDVSDSAIEVAKRNLDVTSPRSSEVNIVSGNWFEALPVTLKGEINLVVSNPPYIASKDLENLQVAKYEPLSALSPGPVGTEAISEIIDQAPSWLCSGGGLIIEIGEDQGTWALEYGEKAGLCSLRVEDDLAGKPRFLVAKKD